jgi:hypothetical protein
MRTFSYFLIACLIALLGSAGTLRADDKVIVHEWGTFTSLQDEHGQAIKGVNVDDEPVPPFVYENAGITVTAQYSQSERNFGLPPHLDRGALSQGWFRGDPQVTMRLETPVLYIYPPKGKTPASVPPLDVHVDFHGGILSQSYPYAEREDSPHPPLGPEGITDQMTSGLTWKGVRLGSTEKPVETTDKVWTTPREVSAPLLEVKALIYDNGGRHEGTQAEHFLFYRGVGHLDSPLLLNQTSLDAGKRGDIFPWCHRILAASPSFEAPAQGTVNAEAWLADIHADGSCRWEVLLLEYDSSGVRLARKFVDSDSSPANLNQLNQLKASMHDALVKEGLYPDEASAMLRTWELSYFKSPGLRFFYIVPRKWVDKVLPLKITGAPTDITRVMVGRIELISDAQKAALARLAAGPCPDLAAVKKAAQDALQNSKLPKADVDAFYRGEKPLSELGITIPPLVQDYLGLGRFRDALIVHEQRQHPSGPLAQFIKDNGLASGN